MPARNDVRVTIEHADDRVDDVVDRDAGGVDDDGAAVGAQRAVEAAHVPTVAFGDRGGDVLDVAADLAHSAGGALLRRCGDEQLEGGIGEHDRADIAAFDDAAAVVVGPCSLAGTQLGTHARVGCDGTDDGGHLAPADLGRDVLAIDEHTFVGHAQVDRAGELGHSLLVGDGDSAAQGRTAHRPVHRPGVEVLQAEAGGERSANRALAGPGGAVDGDQQFGGDRFLQRSPSAPCGKPSRYPARLCTPTTARSANSPSEAAPA